ncbi:hypothetical protein NP493_1367g01027 [Ridgeia piscesae]|uniref:Calnexin n=1 Tax=Ridgeia piscesae TaxID=27915 RepID=A0AAD9NE93_RIDPI|nr:hypothetical protein NP493_1367g01027 [Ridgeia piscesae]
MKSATRYLWGMLLACLLATSMVLSNEPQDDVDEDGKVEVEDDSAENELKVAQQVYKKPIASGDVNLAEPFDNARDFKEKWVKSEAKKDGVEDNIAKYDGEWKLEEPKDNALKGDLGVVLKSKAKHHAISRLLDTPYEFSASPLVVQYEVKFQNGLDCGGGYIKLLTQSSDLNLKKFTDKTPYTIMFGPDKCGNDNKLHFIFRHKNPVTGKYEEKHAKKPTAALDSYFTDKKTHLYTLVVKPENTFEIFVDQTLVNSGSLLEDFEPAVNPPKEVIDPTDEKPNDWDEREKIPDPEAKKPEDWDENEPEMIEDEDASMPDGWLDSEPALIADPSAQRPTDWDDDMDGEWEPPMISNPACESVPGCGEWKRPQIKNPNYKGIWKATMIDNPNFKGKWKPRKIPNPDYFEDNDPYRMSPIGAVGLELWSMSDDIVFDNFVITDSKSVADIWATDTWEVKHLQEMSGGPSAKSVVQAVLDATHERPWLWAVIIVVVLLPIVLLIAYCCMPGSSKGYVWQFLMTHSWLLCGIVVVLLVIYAIRHQMQDSTATRKKTDSPTADDLNEQLEDADVAANEGGDTPSRGSARKPRSKKSDLDADNSSEAAENNDSDKSPRKGSPTRRRPRVQKE